MWINLDDEESKPMLIDVTGNEEKQTGQQIIVTPVFDIYSKEVGNETGNKRITTFAYEIRTSSSNAIVLKNLLCKTSSKPYNDIKFIPYGLNILTKKETMHEIVIQQKSFFNEANIIPVFGIIPPDKQQVADILGKSLYFTGMEPTIKTAIEGKCLLVTTKSKLYCTQREPDNLLGKYYRKTHTYNNQTETPGRRKNFLIHNHFLTYAKILSKDNPTITNQPTPYIPSSY